LLIAQLLQNDAEQERAVAQTEELPQPAVVAQPIVEADRRPESDIIWTRDMIPGGGSGVWRRGVVCEAIWFILVNFVLVISLAIDRDHNCEGHQLYKWAYVQTFIQSAMILANIMIQWRMPPRGEDINLPRNQLRLRNIASFYVVSRFLNIFWIIWVIMGIVWTFEGKVCAKQIPVLYYVCFFLSIIHSIILGIPVLVCCCSIPGILATYWCCPNFFGNKPSRRASVRMIKKLTIAKPYKVGLMPQEDANCAICLCEYEDGEEIRYLSCDHHFHGKCIMMWLVKTKSCPFCKKDIDATKLTDEKVKGGKTDEHVVLLSNSPNQTLDESGGVTDEGGDEEQALVNTRTGNNNVNSNTVNNNNNISNSNNNSNTNHNSNNNSGSMV